MAPDAQAQVTLAAPPPLAAAATLPAVRVTRTARADWQPAEADPPLAAGAVVDGRYRVVALIGEGGMGRVYEIEHLFLRRRLALKLVRRDAGTGEAAARLLQEAVLAGQVSHATVVPVFDCAALPDGQVYVAMELLRGESLEEALLRPQPAAEVLRWLAEVARGLAAAHRAGIVHRDVKPANLFLAQASDGTLQPRILDFGIAKLLPGLSGEAAAGVQTQAGALLGTPFYMAPERIRGETGDARADLYALGVILYEALTGQLPFVGEGFMEIVGRHLHEAPLDPRQAAPQRQIPDALAELTLALLRKDAADRPRDGDAVAADLLEVAAREEAVATLTLGAAAPAVPQAIAEEATQQLDASARTEVLAAGPAGEPVTADMSQGAALTSAAQFADTGAAIPSERLSGAGAPEVSFGSGRSRGAADMSLGADDQSGERLSSETAPRGGMLRAAALLLLCAAGGGLVAWALGAGEVETPPDVIAGPPVPPQPPPPVPPAPPASLEPPPTPEPTVNPEPPPESGPAASSGPATSPGAVEPTKGPGEPERAAPQADEPTPKKRPRKPPRKAGTTGQGPRGSGPKIKTDVYDE